MLSANNRTLPYCNCVSIEVMHSLVELPSYLGNEGQIILGSLVSRPCKKPRGLGKKSYVFLMGMPHVRVRPLN